MKFSKILKFWCEILMKTGRGPNSFVFLKKRKEKISSVFWPLLEKLRDDTLLFYGNRKVSSKAICGRKKKKIYVVKFFRNGLWNFKSGPNSFAWQYTFFVTITFSLRQLNGLQEQNQIFPFLGSQNFAKLWKIISTHRGVGGSKFFGHELGVGIPWK